MIHVNGCTDDARIEKSNGGGAALGRNNPKINMKKLLRSFRLGEQRDESYQRFGVGAAQQRWSHIGSAQQAWMVEEKAVQWEL